MDSADLSVLKTLADWQEDKLSLWLATVVETFGSSPRPRGAMLAVRGDGLFVGSVSGGCIEEDIASRARSGVLPSASCEILSYGVTAEEARRFGLPCGGSMRLVVEPVREACWVGEILCRIQGRRLAKRTLHLDSSRVFVGEPGLGEETNFDGRILTTVHGPTRRLLVIGAGQISSYLARMASALDYEVTICEPREEMRKTWEVPGTLLSAEMPDEAVLALKADSSTAIVALTHDPKLDDMALLEALKSDAFYVGALGSRASSERRRERLALFDLTPSQIGMLHGPVGLPIGSRTPPEIAISILAHLISVRNGKAGCQTKPEEKEICS